MEALINLIKQRNPEFAEYFDLIKQFQQKDEDETENTTVSINKEINKLEDINKKLFSIIGTLKKQLHSEMELNDELAKAIGSCSNCLGNDPECIVCKGLGKPGYFIPEQIYYNKYITPAIKSFEHQNYKR